MNNKPSNDYIDLAEILDFFWDNKHKIIIVTFLFIFLAVSINSIFPKHYKSSTPIEQIATKDFSVYSSNNSINIVQKRILFIEQELDMFLMSGLQSKQFRNQMNESDSVISPIIDKDYFLNMFIKEMKSIDNIKNAFAETVIFKNSYDDTDLYETALENAATKLKIEIDKKTEEVALTYPAKSKQQHILALQKLSKLATEKVRLSLILQTEEIIEQYEQQKKVLLSELDKAEKNARSDFEETKKLEVRELLNQIALARAQGISKMKDYQMGDILNNFSDTVGKYPYLRGYIALEKELEFLKNANADEDFRIRGTMTRKRALSDDTLLERTKRLIESLPYVDKEKEFIAADFEPLQTIFEDSRSSKTLIIIFLLLGIIMGSLYSVVTRTKK